MANEITINTSINMLKGGVDLTRAVSKQADMTGTFYAYTIQNVGTAAENVTMGDVGTPGVCLFRNTDSTNFVLVGRSISATFQPFAKMLPGEFCSYRSDGNTPQLKADTAACNVETWVIES